MEGNVTYKATPHNWSENKSFLILEKVVSKLSNGKVLERFKVVKRWSAQGYGEKGIFTDSLKGVEYTKNELTNLSLYNEIEQFK